MYGFINLSMCSSLLSIPTHDTIYSLKHKRSDMHPAIPTYDMIYSPLSITETAP